MAMRRVVFLMIAGFFLGGWAHASAQEALLLPTRSGAGLAATGPSATVYTLHPAVSAVAEFSLAGQTLFLPGAMDGQGWTITVREHRREDERTVILTGSTAGAGGLNFTMALVEDHVAGTLNAGSEGLFELVGTLNAVRVNALDPLGGLPCGGGLVPPAPSSGLLRLDPPPVPLGASGMVTVDVVVVYTPQARVGAGSKGAIEAAIATAVAQANAVFSNSQINAAYRLRYTGEVAYNDTGDMLQDLNSLSEGAITEAYCLRERYGADLVSLIVEDAQYGGLAWIFCDPNFPSSDNGFSVCLRSQLPYYVLAHEMGHNLGCDHDRQNPSGCRAHSYSYGHRFTNDSINVNKTVMAYDPGYTVPHFSNPNVNWFGQPTGVAPPSPQQAFNASTITGTVATIAAYRSARPLSPTNFLLDACADAEGYLVANPGMTIYAAVRSNHLYVATWSPGSGSGGLNDHYIFVSDALLPSASASAPWAKSGLIAVAGNKPFLGAESTSDYIGWFNAGGTSSAQKHPHNAGQMEGVLDLVATFGRVPSILYLASAAYATADGGALQAQAPTGSGPNMDPAEFLVMPVAALLDRNLDGLFDRLDPAFDFLAHEVGFTSGGRATVTWASVPGQAYQVQGVGTLAQEVWAVVQVVTGPPASATATWTNPVAGTTSVYRIAR